MPRRFQVVVVTLALMLGIVVGAWGAVATSDTASSASVEQLHHVLQGLQRADQQRQKASAQSALAFALILENFAAAFATPPAPDPARLKAVEGLCKTARTFRLAAGDTSPPVCPAL